MERKSGILLHITSLPGRYGIGDLGREAYRFVRFLNRSGQKYWQVLPLNALNAGRGYSPYASPSAFAGNILLIDPEQLVENGLLMAHELKLGRQRSSSVDYINAEMFREQVIEYAHRRFRQSPDERMEKEFNEFREKEIQWLEDFALFTLLKQKFDQQPWSRWPEAYKKREKKALDQFLSMHEREIERIMFGQYLFQQQWNQLREYAAKHGVSIFGDMPIYVDYDSADVWAHPSLFKLDRHREMEVVAGVPPDYFNEEGQRWGMPLFNWKSMERKGFHWWTRRIERNMQWFDLVRLDHFRGFSAYWEIPAEETTAINGSWKEGPGNLFFNSIRKTFPEMPFVAEDLGMIDEPVHKLRDHYKLPGMKVLQFGFGEDVDHSEHAPHNIPEKFIAYTGTHDNNTLKGWFRAEADPETRLRLNKYFGKTIKASNISKEMIRATYQSKAFLVIIPLQDWLSLGDHARLNTPSTTAGNWIWKLKSRRYFSRGLVRRINKLRSDAGRI